MTKTMRLTSADLEVMPLENGKRYEIIGGELYVTRQPTAYHQVVAGRINVLLEEWKMETHLGVVIPAPGVIFAEDDDVAPDVVWVSTQRYLEIVGDDGHLYGAPELMVEVLSPGTANERRDREIKLKLYSRQGVDEYWIVDPRARTVDVFRRTDDALDPVQTLAGDDVLQTSLLPGFRAPLKRIFAPIP